MNFAPLDIINYLPNVATALLLIVGIGLMAVRRRAHGRGSVLGISGCVLLLVGLVVNFMVPWLMPMLSEIMGGRLGMSATLLITGSFHLVGTGLLIGAVVARRPAEPAPPRQPQWGPQPGWQQPGWQQPPQG